MDNSVQKQRTRKENEKAINEAKTKEIFFCVFLIFVQKVSGYNLLETIYKVVCEIIDNGVSEDWFITYKLRIVMVAFALHKHCCVYDHSDPNIYIATKSDLVLAVNDL